MDEISDEQKAGTEQYEKKKFFPFYSKVHFVPKNVSCERMETGVVLVHELFPSSPLGEEKIQSLVKATFFPHNAKLGNDAENVLTEKGRVEEGLEETDLLFTRIITVSVFHQRSGNVF